MEDKVGNIQGVHGVLNAKRLLIACMGILVVAGIAGGIRSYVNQKSFVPSDINNQKKQRFLFELKDRNDFLSLQGEPLANKFPGVESVKVVWALKSDKLCFIGSDFYTYHHDFCAEKFGFGKGLDIFNKFNYSTSPAQEFVLANLNYYSSENLYSLEFTSSTLYSPEQLNNFYKKVSAATWIGNKLKVLINTGHLLANDAELICGKVFPSELYKGQNLQIIQSGSAKGILRLMDEAFIKAGKFSVNDVLIVKGSPVFIPPCAALVSDQFQTPLSHISVLCNSRKIPAAADKNLFSKAEVKLYLNKPVELFAGNSGLTINLLPEAEKLEVVPAGKSRRLWADVSTRTLIAGKALSLKSSERSGMKAAAFGELADISRKSELFSVPEGSFAIPFAWYEEHVNKSGIKEKLDSLFKNNYGGDDELKKFLKRLRKAIKETPVNQDLLQQVTGRLNQCKCGNSFRFRSSSNAEDLEGFSAAGIYESTTGRLTGAGKNIEDAIREVWAGNWRYEAFIERRLANIDQTSAKMAVLVHRSFPDEAVNGVAITKNLYRSGFPGMVINIQKGNENVVDGSDSLVSEQFIMSSISEFRYGENEITRDFLTFSTLSPGKSLISSGQTEKLYKALDRIKTWFFYNSHWLKTSSERDFGLDVEFKFDKDGKLYLKQVRPYY